ncbi:zf-CCHC domain-containing protein [Tanacetum coccineum]
MRNTKTWPERNWSKWFKVHPKALKLRTEANRAGSSLVLQSIISVITNDGRNIVGLLKGFDQATNIILDESHERVYSTKGEVNLSAKRPVLCSMRKHVVELPIAGLVSNGSVMNIDTLKALDDGFSSKNYVRKFLRALHPKWRAKVMAIKESKDLSSLALDELIGNLKVHEVVMEKDSEIYRGKKRVKSIALKAKKESSDDETSTSESDDKEYVMAVRNFKKFFKRKGKFVRQPREEKKSFRQRDEKKGKSNHKCFRCGDPNHLIGDCPKPSRNKDQKAFIRGSWSISENTPEGQN